MPVGGPHNSLCYDETVAINVIQRPSVKAEMGRPAIIPCASRGRAFHPVLPSSFKFSSPSIWYRDYPGAPWGLRAATYYTGATWKPLNSIG